MVLTPIQYIDRVAERAVENGRLLSQGLRQRRNQVVDLQGIEFTRVGTEEYQPSFYVSISQDMIYMERFEFKLIIENASGGNFRVSVDGLDITAYLMAQFDGQWITGNGIFPALDINKNYDILEAASDLYAEGRSALAEKLVSPGYKKITISSNDPFTVTMSQYIKYSHLNR